MAFYLEMFFLNMISGVALARTTLIRKEENRTKIYLFLTFIQFTLIAGLRSSEVGWDTGNYIRYFEMVSGSGNLKNSIQNMYWLESGYIILCYVVYVVGGNAQTSLFVAGALVYALILMFIYRHALSPVLGVMSLFSFPVFYDSLNMLRNAIVCGLFLLALKYIEERKPIKYIICTIVACMFHTVAVVFILLYFVRLINWKNWINTVKVIAVVFIVYVWILPIINWIFRMLRRENYLWYVSGDSYWFGQQSGGWRTAIFYTLIVLLGYFMYIRRKDENEGQDNLSGYALLLPASAFLYTIAPMFIRIMLMMMPVAGVFVSNEIKMLKNGGNRRIIVSGYCVLLLAFQIFTLYSNAEHYVPYIPFWEG